MRFFRLIGLVSGLVLLPWACSANTDGLFGGNGDDGSGGSSAGGATNTTTNTTSDGGAGPGPGPGPAPASVGSGGAGPAQSSVVASSSSGGDVKVEIPCGNQTCTGTDICCVSQFAASQDHCAPQGQCGSNFIEVACNGPMDCMAGQICCGRFSQQQQFYIEVDCSPTCDNSGPGLPIVMCGDDPSACAPNQGCYPSNTLPAGHSFCQ